MQLKCVAIDDEPLALELVKAFVAEIPQLQLVQAFDDAISGGEFLRNNPVDLLFVDVSMPDVTGIDLVRSLELKPMIIFTTAHKKFAYDGFELEAIDYLLKPIDLNRFKKAVTKALEFHQYKNSAKESSQENIFVRSEYRMVKIDLTEIDYIEGLEDYIRIHLTNSRPVLTLMTLKSVLEKLPSDRFRRIHRSYIIPVNKVRFILNKRATLSSGTELPISDTYSGFINEWMNKPR